MVFYCVSERRGEVRKVKLTLKKKKQREFLLQMEGGTKNARKPDQILYR